MNDYYEGRWPFASTNIRGIYEKCYLFLSFTPPLDPILILDYLLSLELEEKSGCLFVLLIKLATTISNEKTLTWQISFSNGPLIQLSS